MTFYSTSDVICSHLCLGKTQTNMNEMRLMQRRIMNLERINESLRKELKYLRSCSNKKKIPPEKTDVSWVTLLYVL